MDAKPTLALLATAMIALALVPSASAFTIDATLPSDALTVGTKVDIPVTVTFGQDDCLAIAQGMGTSADVDITSDLGSEWGFKGTTITIQGADCISGAAAAKGTGNVSVTPTSDVIANVAVKPKINATVGEDTQTYEKDTLTVAYVPGHALKTDITFPYTYSGDGAMTFNLTVDVTANGDTMVMFENVDAGDASLSGMEHQKFFFTTGDDAKRTLEITWTPPSSNWDNATISFRNYSHCLADGVECNPQFDETYSWTIENGNPKTTTDAPGEDSPGFGALGLVAALGAIAVALRRRS